MVWLTSTARQSFCLVGKYCRPIAAADAFEAVTVPGPFSTVPQSAAAVPTVPLGQSTAPGTATTTMDLVAAVGLMVLPP